MGRTNGHDGFVIMYGRVHVPDQASKRGIEHHAAAAASKNPTGDLLFPVPIFPDHPPAAFARVDCLWGRAWSDSGEFRGLWVDFPLVPVSGPGVLRMGMSWRGTPRTLLPGRQEEGRQPEILSSEIHRFGDLVFRDSLRRDPGGWISPFRFFLSHG